MRQSFFLSSFIFIVRKLIRFPSLKFQPWLSSLIYVQ